MSSNISKQKRDDLLNKIAQIKGYISAAPQDENTTNLLTFIGEITREVNGKKYGLVFEEHREKIDEMLEENAPVLVEDESLFIDNGGEMNFLIEGDNLAALKLLEKTHRGKIDVIYIDPPYNTGDEDFIYDDRYVDTEDVFRHSKWLSFMEKRLRIAKNLLKNEGIIFISIDKNEGYQFKLLLDSIFGEDNMSADFHVETSVIAGPRRFAAMNGSVVKTAEFVFAYTKKANSKIIKTPMYDYIPGFDTHYKLFWNEKINDFVKFADVLSETKDIKAVFDDLNLKVNLRNLSKVILLNDSVRDWLYSEKISKNLFREGDENESCTFHLDNSKKLILQNGSYFYNNLDGTITSLFCYADRIGKCNDYFENYGERSIRGNLWKGFSADGGNLAKEGAVSFKNGKKPKRLINQLISTVIDNKKDSTILDFFAGSGTTGEAVLDINYNNKSKNKFILCTNNQNDICKSITYQRLKTVIQGKTQNGKNYSEGRSASLKYFKIGFVPIQDKMYYEYADELLAHVKELVELENALDFNSNKTVAIALDDDELEEFIENISEYPECKSLYLGHDVLTSSKQEQIIKANGISINVVPDYYYRDLSN